MHEIRLRVAILQLTSLLTLWIRWLKGRQFPGQEYWSVNPFHISYSLYSRTTWTHTEGERGTSASLKLLSIQMKLLYWILNTEHPGVEWMLVGVLNCRIPGNNLSVLQPPVCIPSCFSELYLAKSSDHIVSCALRKLPLRKSDSCPSLHSSGSNICILIYSNSVPAH